MTFLDPLEVRKHGPRDWEILRHIRYKSEDYEFVIPAGTRIDFASSPRIFWSIIPPTGEYDLAVAAHDWLYVAQPHVRIGKTGLRRMTRKEADDIMLDAMRQTGVAPWRRFLIYQAVRAGGAKLWEKSRKARLKRLARVRRDPNA